VPLRKEKLGDVEKIGKDYLKGIQFHFVKNAKDVLKIALLKEQIKDPINIKGFKK
jgi:ATP-dependent Lon protease